MAKDGRPTLETVAAAAGVSLATVSRCSTTEQMSRPRHAHGCSGYWSSTTTCHLADHWSAGSAGGRRLIDLVFTALDSPYSVEILEGSRRAPWMSWCRRCRTLPTRGRGPVDSPRPDGPGPSSSLPN